MHKMKNPINFDRERTKRRLPALFFNRKDRLRRSLELRFKKRPRGSGRGKQMILELEEIKTFFAEIIIKFSVI